MPSLSIEKKDLGAGVYPTFSLINHSCNASGLPSFYGRHIVIRAARTLSEGDEITLGYCRGSYMQPVEDRHIYLDNVYQFECACEACEGNWPTYGTLHHALFIKCQKCSQAVSEKGLQCLTCGMDYSLVEGDEDEKRIVQKWRNALDETRRAYSLTQSTMEAMMGGTAVNSKPDFNAIRDAIDVLEENVPSPSTILWDARDTLELYFHLARHMNWT